MSRKLRSEDDIRDAIDEDDRMATLARLCERSHLEDEVTCFSDGTGASSASDAF